MLEVFLSVEGLAALAALTAMEIILAIDNIVFISVLVSRLPPESAERARKLGLILALVMRILLLFAITSLLKLNQPVFTLFGQAVSWRDIILFVGGLFLVIKATHEMHMEMEGGPAGSEAQAVKPTGFAAAMVQIAIIDLVFSVDSIITAIGMARDIPIMVAAVLLSMIVMYVSAGPVSAFVHRHPTAKMLALAFLVLVGVALIAESMHQPIDRKIIYGAMAFSVLVEALNLRAAKNRGRRNPIPADPDDRESEGAG